MGFYDEERVKDVLHRLSQPAPEKQEEWAWISRYLDIADKAYKKEREAEAAQAKPDAPKSELAS